VISRAGQNRIACYRRWTRRPIDHLTLYCLSRSGFHWQPGIVYYLYDHSVFDDAPQVSLLTANTPGMAPPPRIHCRVRDDVCVATSSLEMRASPQGGRCRQPRTPCG
jgi:hypothetical protein